MRRLLICVLMTLPLLLTACSLPGGVSKEEELALAIRGEYLKTDRWTGRAALTADYGRRVYQYELTATCADGETLLTLTAPEEAAGITARITGKDSRLEYDGLSVETGPLDSGGLTPVSSIPVMLEAARSGYMTACAMEEDTGLLRVEYGEPEGAPDTGRVVTLWFDSAGHGLKQGEIWSDGFRVVLCRWLEFVKN